MSDKPSKSLNLEFILTYNINKQNNNIGPQLPTPPPSHLTSKLFPQGIKGVQALQGHKTKKIGFLSYLNIPSGLALNLMIKCPSPKTNIPYCWYTLLFWKLVHLHSNKCSIHAVKNTAKFAHKSDILPLEPVLSWTMWISPNNRRNVSISGSNPSSTHPPPPPPPTPPYAPYPHSGKVQGSNWFFILARMPNYPLFLFYLSMKLPKNDALSWKERVILSSLEGSEAREEHVCKCQSRVLIILRTL